MFPPRGRCALHQLVALKSAGTADGLAGFAVTVPTSASWGKAGHKDAQRPQSSRLARLPDLSRWHADGSPGALPQSCGPHQPRHICVASSRSVVNSNVDLTRSNVTLTINLNRLSVKVTLAGIVMTRACVSTRRVTQVGQRVATAIWIVRHGAAHRRHVWVTVKPCPIASMWSTTTRSRQRWASRHFGHIQPEPRHAASDLPPTGALAHRHMTREAQNQARLSPS